MRKRSWVVRISVLLALLALTAACGGGGGGGGGGGTPPPVPLATGTFVKTANLVNDGGNSWPFNTNAVQKLQLLYLSSEIDGSGYMTKISFKRAATVSTSVTCASTTVKLGHSVVSALTVTYANNVEQGQGSQATMIDNGTITIPAGAAGEYFDIPFTTPFYYNGVDNIVVEFTRSAACTAMVTLESNSVMATNRQTGSSASIGATGSGVWPYLRLAKFHFAGGDDAVEFGTSAAPTPFASNWRTQMLYFASEITGTGPITGIGMQANATTVTGSYTYTLKLGHTTVSALTATFANNFNAGTPSTIVTSGSFTIPAGVPAGEYIWIPFPGTFTYNGSDNLIVDIDVSSGAALNYINYAVVGSSNRLVYASSGSTIATALGPVALNTKFRFNGGTMDVIGANGGNANVFLASAGGRQFLLRGAELGTAGSINKLACRATALTTAATYTNFVVTLATTTQNVLVATDATNIAGGTVVYNGTFSMPAGRQTGDWIDIPFSTAFNYNGIDNLVVQTTVGSGTTTQSCQVAGPDATRYADSYKVTGGGTPVDFRANLRFWISK